MSRWHTVAIAIAVACGAGCAGPTPVGPTVQQDTLVGVWAGESTVISAEGFPESAPPYWQTGSVEPIALSLTLLADRPDVVDPNRYLARLVGSLSQTNYRFYGAGEPARVFALGVEPIEASGPCYFKVSMPGGWPTPRPYLWVTSCALNLRFVDGRDLSLEGELSFHYTYTFDLEEGTTGPEPWDEFRGTLPTFTEWTKASITRAVKLSWQGPLPEP